MYTDLTTRAQRMSKIDWKNVFMSTARTLGGALLIVVTLYVFALLNYVVQGMV